MKKEQNNLLIIIISIAAGLLIIGGIIITILLATNKTNKVGESLKTSIIDSKTTYKAVFLLNNQVYFGKIKEQTDKKIVLENVYYLQVNQAQTDKKDDKEADSEQPQISLIRLGEEMHGPKNILELNYQNVLMIEELRSDSKIIEAINNYEKQSLQAPAEVPTK